MSAFKIEVTRYDEWDHAPIDPEGSTYPSVRVTVRLNGLVVAKRRWFMWRSDDTFESAEAAATEDALRMARARVEKWRKGVAMYDAEEGVA